MIAPLARWQERRITRRLGPRTLDHCEVCNRPLRAFERVQLTDASAPRHDEFGYGGGGISATYCSEHAPKET